MKRQLSIKQSPTILLSLWNTLMRPSSWLTVLSGFTITLWYFNYHLQDNYCRAISPVVTITLGWECSWFDLAIMTYGEAIKPTFGKLCDSDIKVPADDYCLYHCFNYVMANGAASLTRD